MELSNFNKNELYIIETLLKSATEIKNIYKKIYYLEITTQKETDKYNELLNELKKAIRIETNIYQKLNLKTEEKFKIIEFLTNSPNYKKTNDIHSIINQDENDIINRRIINNLIHDIINNINYNNHKTETLNLLKEIGINIDNEKAIKDINNFSQVELKINEDIYLIFLTILQESLELIKYDKYKNELKQAIYNTCYINKNIENIIINQKFNIPNKIYISSKFINEILITNNKIYNLITNLIVQTQINTHIIEVLKIKDNEYNNSKTNISSIINQCYIRTLLTFLTDDNIYKLNEDFHNLTENPQYIKYQKQNTISEKAIIQCFKNINNDRAKKLIISITTQK